MVSAHNRLEQFQPSCAAIALATSRWPAIGLRSPPLGPGAGESGPTLLMQMAGAARVSVGPGFGELRRPMGAV